MATYAVGDIQGCFASLQALLDKCSWMENGFHWMRIFLFLLEPIP